MKNSITEDQSLQITVDRSEGFTTLRLKGRVDIDTSPDLRDRLLRTLQAGSSERITVDLTEVPYLDTSGVATLIEALKIARRRGNVLCLQGLTGSLLHLFEVTGVLALFKSHECSGAFPETKES